MVIRDIYIEQMLTRKTIFMFTMRCEPQIKFPHFFATLSLTDKTAKMLIYFFRLKTEKPMTLYKSSPLVKCMVQVLEICLVGFSSIFISHLYPEP